MKKLSLLAVIASMTSCTPSPHVTPTAQPLPNIPYTDNVKIIKNTLGCESYGTFMAMNDYRKQGDDVAANKTKSYALRRGTCRMLKAGTPVVFYHFVQYTDSDHGAYTTIRRKGDTLPLVVDKCALNSRDPELLRFPGYTTPEKSCQ